MPVGRSFCCASLLLLSFGLAGPARAWVRTDLPVALVSSAKRAPLLVPDGASGVFVAWADGRGGFATPDVYVQRLAPDGSPAPGWPSTGLPVATGAGEQALQSLCPDGAGGCWLVWIDRGDWTGGFVRVQHLAASGAPAPGWSATGQYVTLGFDQVQRAAATSDREGGIFLTWDLTPVSGPATVLGTRLRADGTLAPGWPASQQLPLTDAATSLRSSAPVALVDGAFAVAWIDGRFGGSSVYAQRLTDAGARDAAWPAAGLPIQTQPAIATLLGASADPTGALLLAWWDNRLGNMDLRATRVLPEGLAAPGWPSQGLRVSTTSLPNPTSTCFLADGSSSLIAWMDVADRPRVLRLDAEGAVAGGWPLAGVAPANAGPGASLALAPDGAAGAWLAWTQSDSAGLTATRLLHVLGTGVPATDWPSDGLVLSRGAGDRRASALSWSGPHLAVAWQGPLHAAVDVVAAYVTAGGAPPLGVGVANDRDLQLAPLARPMRGAPAVTIRVARSGAARLQLLDVLGRRAVADAAIEGPASRVVRFPDVSPGLYFARLVQGDRTATTRVFVVR